MTGSIAILFVVHHEVVAAIVVASRAAKDPPPFPQNVSHQVLLNSPSTPSYQDPVQPRASQGVFKPLLFLDFAPQFQQGEPILRHLAPPMVPRSEALPSFQMFQANLREKCANELLDIIYNMIWKQNSQVVEKRILCLKEILHHTNMNSNVVQEAISQRNQPKKQEALISSS